jgi:hypothetical protein
MTREDLIRLARRLAQGPVPTLEKKVYGYQGNIAPLLAALPLSITVVTRVTDACDKRRLPAHSEGIPTYLQEQLAALIRSLQAGRTTSLIVIQEATLLARYHKGWSIVWGNPVVDKTDYDLHFRLVYLIDQANVEDSTLHDDRIAVVIPGPWEDTARDISRRYPIV